MNKMKKSQSGFTLIELVVVIVILGILAATALPKFVDLSSEAGSAAANGVAGALASATATNYAAKVAGKSTAVDITGAVADVCKKGVLEQLITGVTFVDAVGGATPTALPTSNSEFNLLAGATATCAAGGTVTCQVQGAHGSPQTATIICTG